MARGGAVLGERLYFGKKYIPYSMQTILKD